METLTPYISTHTTYMLKSGEIVPSVTQILSAVIAKPKLQKWANQLGLNNKILDDENKTTLGIGKLLHTYIQADLSGAVVDEVGYTVWEVGMAKKSFDQYLKWKSDKQIKTIKLEYKMVSERYKYGGTLDALLELNSELTLLDWKTSNFMSLDYKLQLAAYLFLLQEQGIIPRKVAVLRLPKDGKDYEYYEARAEEHIQKYGEAWLKALDWFKALTRLYQKI